MSRSTIHWFAVGLASVSLAALLAGCSSGPSAVAPPRFDAEQSAREAIAAYDTDGDQALSEVELQQCPGMTLAAFDRDGDGRVTADEISQRIAGWQASELGLVQVRCKVELNGRPLSGAVVRFEPEPFFQDVLPAAEGTTAENGIAAVSISADSGQGESLPAAGVRPGLYKVQITHPTRRLPASVSEKHPLGAEVSRESMFAGDLTFSL